MIEQRNAGELYVSGPMLIANATALLEEGRNLLRADAAPTEMICDLSAVEEADSSALAVVFAWMRTAQGRGRSLRIVHPSASMQSLAALYGVSATLSPAP